MSASKTKSDKNPIKIIEVVQQGGLFKGDFNVCLDNVAYNQNKIYTSPQFIIHGNTLIQIQIEIMKQPKQDRYHQSFGSQEEYKYIFYLKVENLETLSGLKSNVDFTCPQLGVEHKQIVSQTGYQNIIESKQYRPIDIFNVTINVDIVDTAGTFDALYDDTDLTDFELHGEGGSVPVHKAVLAACSPVFMRMLTGDWKENKSGNVNIPNTSADTLQYLKMYMYKRQLPETGFQQLLLLASYYMMPGLEHRCIEKIVSTLSPQNILELCEFAVKNQMQKLHLAILECVQSGQVNVGDIHIAASQKNTRKRRSNVGLDAGAPSGKQARTKKPSHGSQN